MNALTSYLLAQGARRPLQTLRFCVAEVVRRNRSPRTVAANGVSLDAHAEWAERWRPFVSAPLSAEAAARPEDAAVRAQADGICEGVLQIFGERIACGLAPDWHADWVTGHRWPLAPRVRLQDGPPGTDIKRPWEAARFHHGLRLAQAWRMTREARYAAAFAHQVSHWLQHNPYPRGIHWAMPMEAALRAINWISAAALLAHAPLEAEFRRRFLAALHLHGRHIFAHREWNPVARSNHYLACVAGLLFCGIALRDTAEGRRWLEFGRRALAGEMLAQVDADGVAHEGSSGYHLFVAELFLTAALAVARLDSLEHGANGASGSLRAQLGRSWGHAFAARLEKMFEFAAALAEGRDSPPLWGDGDDGRVLPLCAEPAHHAHHLLAVAGALFERADFRSGHACSEPVWRLGASLPPAPARPAAADKPDAAFPRAGFFFFSSGRLRGSVRCGPLGVDGWANHAHCDQLAFELACDGAPVLADPGTCLYAGDPAARNALRSTRAHNTPLVEAAEQNRFWPALLFRMMDDTRSRLLRCHSAESDFHFAGEHYGYQRLRQRITVRRDLQLVRAQDSLLACDTLTGRGVARAEWNFTLAPGIAPEALAPGDLPPLAEAVAEEPMRLHCAWRLGSLRMQVWVAGDAAPAASVVPGWFAPHYGRRVPARVLRFAGAFRLPLRIAFAFAPAPPTEKS